MAHYYDRVTGQLIDRVPYKDPKRKSETKATSLTEARAMLLLPSVTTVQDILDKPGIRRYRMEQMAEAVCNDPWDGQEPWAKYLDRMILKADEKAERAAEFGTEIHHVVADILRGREVHPASHGLLATPIGKFVKDWMDAHDFVCEVPEHTFINERLGFAGTADWVGTFSGRPIILDIKSQEWEETDRDRPYFYEEYPVQLAGYAIGLGMTERERWSLIVNRNHGVADPVVKNWSKPTEKIPDPNSHYEEVWTSLFEHWKRTKRYWPERLREV